MICFVERNDEKWGQEGRRWWMGSIHGTGMLSSFRTKRWCTISESDRSIMDFSALSILHQVLNIQT